MKIVIQAKFSKQTKDSKKESVQFLVTGDDEKRPELNALTREVVILSISDIPGVELKAAFEKTTKDSTKTTLEFVVKGDSSAAQTFEFYKKAGSSVELTIASAQMSMEDFKKAGAKPAQEEENDPDQTEAEFEDLD